MKRSPYKDQTGLEGTDAPLLDIAPLARNRTPVG
jgi:hypothetical protein